MNRYKVTTRAGRIQAGELDYLFEPSEPDPGKKPVILLHGSGAGNYAAFVKGSNWASCVIGPMAAWGGRKVIAGWMGSQSFANDTLMARIDTAMTVLGVTEAHILGVSMGGGGAVRYASLNPSKTASIMCLIPLADIDAVYQANRLGLRADIGTAWGVTYPTPLPSQADLIGVHAPAIAANGTPRRVLYSTVDTSTLPAEVEALAAGMGITPEAVDATYGHTEGTIGEAMTLDPAAPWKDYTDWLDGLDDA